MQAAQLTPTVSIDAKLVRRLDREYSRAIRAEEGAATLPQAYRLATLSERCLRRLQAAQAGLPLPEPRTPNTARNRKMIAAKQGFAALASIGRVIARAVACKAALGKARVALVARKVARAARAALRRAGRAIALLALRAIVAIVVTPVQKEIFTMQAPRLARDIYTNNNHVGVAGRLLRFFDTNDGAQPDAEGAPMRFRLSCLLRADRFVFTGGPQGEHSIAACDTITNAARLLAHWQGYCENTVRFYARSAS